MKHIDILKEKTKRRIPRRFMGILLAAAVTASVMPVGGFAVSDSSERTAELCAHHSVHTAECGFSEEDNAPCGYKCGVCPVEDLIAALPDTVTEDNADDVRAQLDEILALYVELNEDEQGQIDLSSVTELQGALDETNAPMLTAEEINISQNRRNILTAEAGGCPGHTFTGKVQAAMIYVESGAHNVTFSNLNIFDVANVGIASGATMNLTINGTNTIHTDGNLAGIYVPVGATLVINGTGSLNVSGSGGGAGIGGAPYVPDEGGSDGDPNCGTVEINGGTVTATGGTSCGAGIGGGTTDDVPGNGGNVTINGGTVTATGGSDQDYYGGAGIGGAGGLYDPIFGEISSGCGGSLTINGGHVTLAPGQYNPQDNIAYGFGAGSGDVSGGTCELTLADASYLTVDFLDPNGKYTINGDPTEDMIVVPADLVYNGKAQELDGKIYIDDTKTGSGTYFNQTFTVKASAEGWELQDLGEVVKAGEYTATFKKDDKEISRKFTVAQSGTNLADGKVKTYNGETQTDTFTAGDTITVKAAPAATGAAPQKAAARLRADPAAGQMALFVGDVQVSEPVNAGEDGIYTMTVSAADVLIYGQEENEKYTLTVKFVGNANMADALGSVNITVVPNPLTADMVTLSAESGIYSGTVQKPTVTVDGLTAETDYEVTFQDGFKNVGTYTLTVTGKGIYRGTVEKTYTIGKATPTITWSGTSQELTYTGNPAAITAPIVTLVNGENFSGAISYSYKKQGETDYTNGLPVNAGAYSVKAHIDAAGNYAAADSTELTLTIAKAQGTLTVPASPIEKTFGDEEFALNCTTNGDGRIFYSSDNENVATVSADGTVLIKGAGEAEITVSLGEGENYTGADAQTVRIAVAKAVATDNISETKNYTYANGSKGTVTIDVAGKLPRDRGETTYSVSTTDDNGILTGAAADENGNLVFTVSGGVVGNTASITVTAEMENYGDATYTLNIKLVEKKVVEPKTAVTVKGSNILTYGETLSGLAFNSVIFVEQGTETEVKGTLSWKNPDTIPTVGTKSAEWVFTPEDNGEYAELTGTAAITVVKATPNVKAPTAENITYDPSKTLPDVGLSGGSAVWTVGDSSITVEGVWSWKSASTVPTVRNSGYTAVFTPSDTVNYNTAECTVAVAVAKAEPYIAVPPTAAQITYGDSLSDSVLDGGTVQYSNSDATAVAGGFAWKDGTIKPVVSDSGSTEYAVIFTPTDTANYNSTETKLTLTVKKAENAPNMPSDVMNVKRSCEKVSDVELPKDWQWLDADKDTALEINVGIKATAVYVGTDKGNYEHETAEVTITRADCDHIHTELRNVKAATCKEKGYSGDTYCLDCEKLLLKGSETDTTDHSGGVATCTHGKICDMCGMEYTAKDSGNHTHTEIRGAKDATCTAEGYTGDTYCTDCETITETGTALPIVPHDWQVTSEEPATTVSEGKRIYTCSMCKQTREETLPKLPQPSHKHSYSEKTTKEATCTESGEAILSCSCGDTIIRSISALGHNYRSEVTKPATVTEAGVMTYTCTRCGHSYTETIKKLEGDPTKPDTRPETGKPFIKDENGKDGWSIINEELGGAEDGSTVTVDMNGAAIVPKTIFDTLKGRNVTAVFDMGGGITWSVNGKDITSDKTSDIDFSVKPDTDNIPVDVINNITGERYSIQISLAHNGEFGFTAVLSINLGSGNAGHKAALYYYNGGALELMCESEISADGTARLTFTHASDYLIVIGESKTDESDNSGTTSSGEVSDPSNGDKDDNDGNPSTGVAVSLIPLAAAAAFIIAAAKRKNK